MPNIIEITDFHAPELDIYARLSEVQLLHFYEPKPGIFIAESPKVVERALNAGYRPISILLERKHIAGEAREILARCGNIPVYTADYEILTRLTGFALTRGMLCAMQRRQLTQQLATLRTQQERLHDFLEQGIYDADTFVTRNRALNERIKATQAELDALAKPAGFSREETLRQLKPQIEHVIDAWQLCSTAGEKNDLARTVVSKIIYSKTRRCYRNEDPGKYLTLDLLPVSLCRIEG